MNFKTFLLNLFKLQPTLRPIAPKSCILITGCDSGLGFNLSLYCSKKFNFTVISGCLNTDSEGAKILKSKNSNIIPIHLDLLKQETIENTYSFVENLISEGYTFSAIVNNAGIMCFGEFEWQTRNIFESQINVNLLGTMKLTHKFIPMIRIQKSRIINVTSHCGLQSLPGLSVYSATKCALKAWNDALRVEMFKYEVDVVNFIPGSFVAISNIAAKQNVYADEMKNEFTVEQEKFYGKYFEKYNEYLKFISGYKKPSEMHDQQLFRKFELALLEETPKTIYKVETWRYKFYFYLFKILPVRTVDWLTEKFVSMPEYKLYRNWQ